MKICQVHQLGQVPYQQAWDLQNQLAAEIARGERPPTLLLLEHPHTYTFGRRGNAENLLWDEATLRQRGVDVHWVDRGGDVTYHGPGQLVGYPIIPLGTLQNLEISQSAQKPDHVGYVRNLEQALIVALARLGVATGQLNGKTGVWVQADAYSRCPRCRPEDRQKPAKIAAIGVKVDVNGITRHGFALNISPDMDFFDGIIPCGIREYPVVSLADMRDPTPSLAAVSKHVIEAFGEVFQYQMAITSI